jgi:outer membrane lipoprotein SlyB
VITFLIDEDKYVGDFLEHFGKKGMRWGVVRRAAPGDWKSRGAKQKLGLVAGGAVGYNVAALAVNKTLGKKYPLAKVLVMAGGAVVGARVTRNMLQKEGSKKVSSLPKRPKAA